MRTSLAQHDAQQAVKRAAIARNRAAVDVADAMLWHEADSDEVQDALDVYRKASRRLDVAYAALRKVGG